MGNLLHRPTLRTLLPSHPYLLSTITKPPALALVVGMLTRWLPSALASPSRHNIARVHGDGRLIVGPADGHLPLSHPVNPVGDRQFGVEVTHVVQHGCHKVGGG